MASVCVRCFNDGELLDTDFGGTVVDFRSMTGKRIPLYVLIAIPTPGP